MRFLKADKLFSGTGFLADDTVVVLNGQGLLQDLVAEKVVEQSNIERLKGMLVPGFVNAHCHLELSHLKGKIAQRTGLPGFAKQVVIQRHNAPPEEIKEHAREADREMWKNGIVAVGDISNGEDSFEIKAESSIFYHTFAELIGLKPENAVSVFEKGGTLLFKLKQYGLSGSFAPHAPYSTSKELIELIAAHCKQNNLPLSIHNQESEEETKFFEGKKNDFEELYRFLNLDISWYKAPKTSSLKYYSAALPDNGSILVHNTFTRAEDVTLVKKKSITWCFCPGANKYIENRLPDLSTFEENSNSICFGTDSLASNTQLNLLTEANLTLGATYKLSQENILKAITFTGAKALNISGNYGQLITGKNAGLNLIEFRDSKIELIKKIV